MATQLELGGIVLDVVRKDIKNIHLSVYPPAGRVRVSAPKRMNLSTIRVFAISKLGWIKQQQKKLREQKRETPREYLNRESHYVWGKRYLLEVIESSTVPTVQLKHRKLSLRVRPTTTKDKKRSIIDDWYRLQLKEAIPPLIKKYEPLMGVEVKRFFVQKMKTKWGSCNPKSKSIRLNTELAKKPPECLEYIVVHEMSQLRERHHNKRFIRLLDRHLPQWRVYRDELNAAPLSHEEWKF